jgi:hypothetical protein
MSAAVFLSEMAIPTSLTVLVAVALDALDDRGRCVTKHTNACRRLCGLRRCRSFPWRVVQRLEHNVVGRQLIRAAWMGEKKKLPRASPTRSRRYKPGGSSKGMRSLGHRPLNLGVSCKISGLHPFLSLFFSFAPNAGMQVVQKVWLQSSSFGSRSGVGPNGCRQISHSICLGRGGL